MRGDLRDEIAEILQWEVPAILRATGVTGLSLAVGDREGLAIAEGYGFSDLRRGDHMTSETVFPVGSVSKLFVATSVAQQREAGELELDMPVSTYLAGFPVISNGHGGRPPTSLELLTHTGGLPTDTFAATFTPPTEAPRDYLIRVITDAIRQEYWGLKPLFTRQPGGPYQYSSAGIALMAQVVEELSGLPYEDYVQKHVLDPLAPATTWIGRPGTAPSEILSLRSVGYARMGAWVVPTPEVFSQTWPGTGMLTTPGDQFLWHHAMLTNGQGLRGRLLTPASIQEMRTPRVAGIFPGEAPGLYTGLSVQVRNPNERNERFGHTASYVYGWWSEAWGYPQLGLIVVAMQNTWDMSSYLNPSDRTAAGLIVDLVEKLVMYPEFRARLRANRRFGGDHAGSIPFGRRPGPGAIPVWQRAYIRGLTLVERLRGLQGIREPISRAAIAAMQEGARPLSDGAEVWNEDAFTAGIAALNDGPVTGERVRALLQSRKCPVTEWDVALTMLEWGARRAEARMPLAFFADNLEYPRRAEAP